MDENLTHAFFSQQCAYIASRAASWAGDCLTLPEFHDQPMKQESVFRFTDSIRGTLDRMDERAGRAALQGRD